MEVGGKGISCSGRLLGEQGEHVGGRGVASEKDGETPGASWGLEYTPPIYPWEGASRGSGSLYLGELSSRPGLPAECIATHHLPRCTVSALGNEV